MSSIKIQIAKKSLIKICYFQNKKLIIFKVRRLVYYKIVPSEYLFYKEEKKYLNIKTIGSFFDLYSTSTFLNSIKIFQFINRKVLVLQGLGLKASKFINARKKFLSLKLGYSHLCNVPYSKEIFLKIRKNLIFLQSYNKDKLGNFAFKIKNLRYPDVYKGKGVLYKNEKLKLKVIKKK